MRALPEVDDCDPSNILLLVASQSLEIDLRAPPNSADNSVPQQI